MTPDAEERRLLRCEADILSRVRWDRVDTAELADLPLGEGSESDFELRAGPQVHGMGRSQFGAYEPNAIARIARNSESSPGHNSGTFRRDRDTVQCEPRRQVRIS